MISIAVGEGTHEPTAGLQLAARTVDGARRFEFGVRRSEPGLSDLLRDHDSVCTNMPGRGLSSLSTRLVYRDITPLGIARACALRRLPVDIATVVASPPLQNGSRSLGTVNGCMQAIIDSSAKLIIEECADIPCLPGAATIPANSDAIVVEHIFAPPAPLSRQPDDIDRQIAERLVTLLPDGAPVQLGVGGAIEAIGQVSSQRARLRIVTGAVGASIESLDRRGWLDVSSPILGSALVGDEAFLNWAKESGRVRLLASDLIHRPVWLARHSGLVTVNVGISADLDGNINSEVVRDRRVSGKGGAPCFARAASLSPGGVSIVILRADRGNAIADSIVRPTLPARDVHIVVSERGIADFRGVDPVERRRRLVAILG